MTPFSEFTGRVVFSKPIVFKSSGKNVPFSCEREVYPLHFSPFQHVPVSCERSLSIMKPPLTDNSI